MIADQRAARLIEAEIFAAEIAHRHQPVAANPLDGCEEAEIGDAGDPRLQHFADLFGEERGDIAVDRVALRLHRAAFEHRDALADLVHRRRLAFAQAPRAEIVRRDQRAMHQQIGIPPDRGGEVAITAQRQPEMAHIRRRIISLRLRAQNLFHDLRPLVAVDHRVEDLVEGLGPHHLPERELNSKGLEIVLERDKLLAARRFVDAVHDRGFLRLQRLGRRNVGGDHVILDQPHRIEPLARGDRENAPLLVEHHAAFRQIEVQRRAGGAGLIERLPASPEREEGVEYFAVRFPLPLAGGVRGGDAVER